MKSTWFVSYTKVVKASTIMVTFDAASLHTYGGISKSHKVGFSEATDEQFRIGQNMVCSLR